MSQSEKAEAKKTTSKATELAMNRLVKAKEELKADERFASVEIPQEKISKDIAGTHMALLVIDRQNNQSTQNYTNRARVVFTDKSVYSRRTTGNFNEYAQAGMHNVFILHDARTDAEREADTAKREKATKLAADKKKNALHKQPKA